MQLIVNSSIRCAVRGVRMSFCLKLIGSFRCYVCSSLVVYCIPYWCIDVVRVSFVRSLCMYCDSCVCRPFVSSVVMHVRRYVFPDVTMCLCRCVYLSLFRSASHAFVRSFLMHGCSGTCCQLVLLLLSDVCSSSVMQVVFLYLCMSICIYIQIYRQFVLQFFMQLGGVFKCFVSSFCIYIYIYVCVCVGVSSCIGFVSYVFIYVPSCLSLFASCVVFIQLVQQFVGVYRCFVMYVCITGSILHTFLPSVVSSFVMQVVRQLCVSSVCQFVVRGWLLYVCMCQWFRPFVISCVRMHWLRQFVICLCMQFFMQTDRQLCVSLYSVRKVGIHFVRQLVRSLFVIPCVFSCLGISFVLSICMYLCVCVFRQVFRYVCSTPVRYFVCCSFCRQLCLCVCSSLGISLFSSSVMCSLFVQCLRDVVRSLCSLFVSYVVGLVVYVCVQLFFYVWIASFSSSQVFLYVCSPSCLSVLLVLLVCRVWFICLVRSLRMTFFLCVCMSLCLQFVMSLVSCLCIRVALYFCISVFMQFVLFVQLYVVSITLCMDVCRTFFLCLVMCLCIQLGVYLVGSLGLVRSLVLHVLICLVISLVRYFCICVCIDGDRSLVRYVIRYFVMQLLLYFFSCVGRSFFRSFCMVVCMQVVSYAVRSFVRYVCLTVVSSVWVWVVCVCVSLFRALVHYVVIS